MCSEVNEWHFTPMPFLNNRNSKKSTTADSLPVDDIFYFQGATK